MKQMVKMNEAVGLKNRLRITRGGKRLFRPFRRQQLWKCMGCFILAVTYGRKGHNLGSEIPKYFGRTAPTKL